MTAGPRLTRTLGRATALLAGLSVLAYLMGTKACYSMLPSTPYPLDIVLPLQAGDTVRHSFSTSDTALHLVRLIFDEQVPSQLVRSVCAGPPPSEQNDDIVNRIDVTWMVTHSGEVIGRGSSPKQHSASGRLGKEATCSMGRFHAEAETSYEIHVDVYKTISNDQLAYPRLLITSFRGTGLNLWNLIILSRPLIGACLGLAAFSCAAAWVVAWRRGA